VSPLNPNFSSTELRHDDYGLGGRSICSDSNKSPHGKAASLRALTMTIISRMETILVLRIATVGTAIFTNSVLGVNDTGESARRPHSTRSSPKCGSMSRGGLPCADEIARVAGR